MAAVPDQDVEKKQQKVALEFNLPDPAAWTKEEIEGLNLDEESKQLIQYKCKYELGKDNVNLTFMPSRHLYGDDGKWTFDKDRVRIEEKEQEDKKQQDDYDEDEDDDDSDDDSEYMVDDVPKIEVKETDIDKACSKAAKSVGCDAVESTFVNENPDMYKDLKVICLKDNSLLIDGNGGGNGFIQACELAWAKHYPLKIDPSHIWLCITQGVALHVEKNAETLREKWVKHEGKKKLIVNRDGFVKGSTKNDWAGVIDEFCEQIDKNTAEDSVPLLDADFSNVTKIDKINTKITIMDICKSYFKYILRTRCGFPKITLTGTKQDWIKIYQKSEKLLKEKVEPKFGEAWSKALLPILQRFIIAFDGKIDCLFWNSMIKRGASYGSGGKEWYSGWLNVFFPIIEGHDNEFCVPYESSCDYIKSGLEKAADGNNLNDYPNGLSSAPMVWEYLGLELQFKFIGGFLAVKIDPEKENELTPMTGWLIAEQTKQNEQAMKDIAKMSKGKEDHTAAK